MLTVISFIVVLGILIFIHELGHFAVAKFSGVEVERFSFGFGPKIIGIKRGETEYRLSLLPLGGYVKMLGESPGEDVQEKESSRSFSGKSVLTRSSIVAAGPVMNLLLAAFLLPLIFIIGIQMPAYLEKAPQAGFVAEGEAAEKAGVLKGDIVMAVDGRPVKNWEELLSIFTMSPGKRLKLSIERDGRFFTTVLTPEPSPDTGGGYGGMYPEMKPLIGAVADKWPARDAGLKKGDIIKSVNGSPITHWAELEGFIHKDGSRKRFTVEREGTALEFDITPAYNNEMKMYLVGISRQEELVFKRYGFFDAVVKGSSTAVEMTGRLFTVIKGLVTGQYSIKSLGGPIMIAQVAGKAAESGVVDLLSLVAFLSLQLGIINLFPIPVLDGGHLMFFAIESVKGSPISEKIMTAAQQAGIAILIALMALVTYNDIFRILR